MASDKLAKLVCRTLGHNFKESYRYVQGGWTISGTRCTRCKKDNFRSIMGPAVYIGEMPKRVDVPIRNEDIKRPLL